MTRCLLNVCWRGAAGLMVAVTLGCSNGHQLDSPALEARLANIEAKLDSFVGVSHDADVRLKEIEQAITDQKTWPETLETRLANIEAKLGAPIGVSHDADVRLKEIEQTIADQKTWPADSHAAEALRDKLAQIMDGMSPATQEAAIARLWPLRWAVQAFWTLRRAGGDGEADPAGMADELYAVLDAAPESCSVSLRQELESARQRAEQAAQRAMRQQVLDAAKALIKDEKAGDPAEVWENLQRFAEDDKDQEISDTRDQLRRALTGREIKARCDELRAQHGRIGTDLDEATRQAALTRLYEAAAGYRLDMLLGHPEGANDLDDLNKFIAQAGEDLRRLAKS